MDFQLQPLTEPGRRMVDLAEKHQVDLAAAAADQDGQGTFPAGLFPALRRSGFLGATVPEELKGLGVESVHDMAVAFNRLGRADGSAALAANMHLAFAWYAARAWRQARAEGDEALATSLGDTLTLFRLGRLVNCSAAAEAGIEPGYARTRARRVEGGWRVEGRKVFATNSPVATLFSVFLTAVDDDGTEQLGVARLSVDAPGLEVVDTWDALGMRATGSGDVVLHDCFVPEEMMSLLGPPGPSNQSFLAVTLFGVAGLVGAFLGVAEAARDLAVEAATSRRRDPGGRPLAERAGIQLLVAETEVDLAACRAILGRSLVAVDAHFGADLDADPEDLPHLMKDFQCAKWFVNRKAIDVVDRAMTVVGGGAYMSGHPLSRLYRDVRAGPFMQAYSPVEALEYVGRLTLGLDPSPGGVQS